MLTALVALAIAIAWGAQPALAVVPAQPGIMVLAGEGVVQVKFRSASCRVGGGFFRANATAAGVGGTWRLAAAIPRFTTFRSYPMTWGFSGPGFFIYSPAGTFSNRYGFPNDAPHPPSGGAIDLSAGRSVMGFGFISAWNATDSASIAMAGRATCRYPPPPRRR